MTADITDYHGARESCCLVVSQNIFRLQSLRRVRLVKKAIFCWFLDDFELFLVILAQKISGAVKNV